MKEPAVPMPPNAAGPNRIRIGAVSYLNSRPLVDALARLAPTAQITVDLPSRLADGLTAGRLDVALIPSIEYFRHPERQIVSDACVVCEGRVKSVKLLGRVPVERVRRLALDEGSRTSAALVQILLCERYRLHLDLESLPIGASVADSTADAVLLIGDRAMQYREGSFEFVWDLGEEWSRWTGLPFVFALWIARPGLGSEEYARLLATARDDGVQRFEEIARGAAVELNLPEPECLTYLRDHLRFHLGPREREGLELFFKMATRHRLVAPGAQLAFCD